MHRIDSNNYAFKNKWLILRSVKDNRLMSLFPDKFGIVFTYEEIDTPIEDKFHRTRIKTHEVRSHRREAFEEFMKFILWKYDGYKVAIVGLHRELKDENELEQINNYSFQAVCACGYRSRVYQSLKQASSDEGENCCKCNDLLDLVRVSK